MSAHVRYLPQALATLDEIYDYTLHEWGEAQADAYVSGLFDFCDGLKKRPLRPIPEAIGVTGYFAVYRRHHIYWREAVNGDGIIVTILQALKICLVISQQPFPSWKTTSN